MQNSRRLFLSIAVASMLAAAPALANDCEVSETNMEMAECLGASYESADSELNYLYQETLVALEDTDASEKLKVAQRSWVKFRDQACEAEAAYFEGGSAMALVRLECLNRTTWARVADLSVLLELLVGTE